MRTNRHNTGLAFQEAIYRTAAEYQHDGVLRLRKVDPPTRVVGGGANRRIIFQPNPFLDFVGCWTERRGRAVFIEAKSTSEPKLPFDSSSGVTTSQLDSLRHWHNAGAVAFVLWEHAGKTRMLTAPYVAQYRDAARAGDGFKHVKWEDAGPDIPQGKGFRLVDFIHEMRARWKA
jgi:penicillin-binding protein-related factor A (putative recombinase)